MRYLIAAILLAKCRMGWHRWEWWLGASERCKDCLRWRGR